MLKIENLAVSKELGRAEMGAIVGGASIFQNNGINYNSISGFAFASPQTNVAPVTLPPLITFVPLQRQR